MTVTEELARDTLAAAHRIASYDGLAEGTWNHLSYMLDDERMLITPADTHWSLIEPDSLVLAEDDAAARALGLQFYIGYRIHYPVHRARPDARCAVHLHAPYATALTLLEDEAFVSASQTSVEFHGRVAYTDEFDLLGGPEEQGKRIADALGDKDILFMRGHGILTVAPTIERAYLDAYLLELACRTQILAMSTGKKLRVFTDEEAIRLRPTTVDNAEAERHFVAMRKRIDANREQERMPL
jgi:ribulose-5-phosphate 4-epimerase/fuculose-1-phosphate aldolase